MSVAMVGQVADIITVQNVHDSSGDGDQGSLDYYNIPGMQYLTYHSRTYIHTFTSFGKPQYIHIHTYIQRL
jgi:hypothetical protein